MNSLPGRMLSAGEKWMYVHADAIVFTKEGDVDHIKEMGWDTAHGGKIDLKKCHYVNNGVKLSDYYESIEKNVLDDPDLTSDWRMTVSRWSTPERFARSTMWEICWILRSF